MNTEKKYLDETEVYLNQENRSTIIWELLVYAHMMYKKVYVFQHFEKFAASFRERDAKGNPPKEYWDGLHYEKLIDHIKICVAFENYNKAVLLSKGFVVHKIDSKKNQALAKKQRLEPVPIEEFLRSNKFVQDNPYGEWYLEGLSNFNTITFSLTLSEGYQRVINLDNQFVHYLKGINDKRNRLHFYKNYAGAFRVESMLAAVEHAKNYGTNLIENEIDEVKEHI